MLMIFAPHLFNVKIRMIMRESGNSNVVTGAALNGKGSITGRVLEKGIPVSRRVMLYERATGAYVAQVRSDSEGYYKFKRTNENDVYFAVSIDDYNDGTQYSLKGQDLLSGNHDKLNSE